MGAFEGNKAETTTMLPMINRLKQTYRLDGITVVADAGMFSTSNKDKIVDAGLDYILGSKTKDLPYPVEEWQQANPGQEYADGQIWVHTNRAGRGPDGPPRSITYFQYSHSRARRSLRGIDEQVSKAERAVSGKAAIKRNRYVDLKAPGKSVNYELADKHRLLAGIKGYETTRTDLDANQVINAYRQLLHIEKSFRMSKHDLKARPVYHRLKDSIDAHLSIVMAALAITHQLETRTGVSTKRLVRTLRKYRQFQLKTADQTIHAAIPLPPNVQTIINKASQSI